MAQPEVIGLSIIMDTFAVFFICLALAAVCREVKAVLRRPVRPRGAERIDIVLGVSGDAPDLQETVRAIAEIRGTHLPTAGIVIRDLGMSGQTRRMAELMAGSGDAELVSGTGNTVCMELSDG